MWQNTDFGVKTPFLSAINWLYNSSINQTSVKRVCCCCCCCVAEIWVFAQLPHYNQILRVIDVENRWNFIRCFFVLIGPPTNDRCGNLFESIFDVVKRGKCRAEKKTISWNHWISEENACTKRNRANEEEKEQLYRRLVHKSGSLNFVQFGV